MPEAYRKSIGDSKGLVRIALLFYDGWLIENSLNACRVLSCKIKTDLYSNGLVTYDEKSIRKMLTWKEIMYKLRD